MADKKNSLLGGYNIGQIIGESLTNRDNINKKYRKRQNIAALAGLIFGTGGQIMQQKNRKVVEDLDQSNVINIAKSSKMYDDAVKLQATQESIDTYGGGFEGARIHYEPQAELAFNGAHSNLANYYNNDNLTQSLKD